MVAGAGSIANTYLVVYVGTGMRAGYRNGARVDAYLVAYVGAGEGADMSDLLLLSLSLFAIKI